MITMFIQFMGDEGGDKLEDMLKIVKRMGELMTRPPSPILAEENISLVSLVGIDRVLHESRLDWYGEIEYYETKLMNGIPLYNYLFYFVDENGPLVIHNREFWGCNAAGFNGGSDLNGAMVAIEKSGNAVSEKRLVQVMDDGVLKSSTMIILLWEGDCEAVNLVPWFGEGYFDFIARMYPSGEPYSVTDVVKLNVLI